MTRNFCGNFKSLVLEVLYRCYLLKYPQVQGIGSDSGSEVLALELEKVLPCQNMTQKYIKLSVTCIQPKSNINLS